MFLNDLTGGDTALRQRILEMIGIILTGYPSKAFFLLEGESGTGKSQFVNFLRDVLGEDACCSLNDISQLGSKWTTGSVFGKLLCLCGDVPDAPLTSKAIGTIKQLTGDDLIRGEFKYKDPFYFENTSKLLFVSNYPLQIPNQSQEDALLDRLIAMPCRNPVPKERRISGLHKLLHEESGYIVQLALDALRDFEDRNGIFTPLPEYLRANLVETEYDEQDLADFIQEFCTFSENSVCAVKTLFEAFRNYAPESQLDVAQFSKKLVRQFPTIKRVRNKTTRSFSGITLR